MKRGEKSIHIAAPPEACFEAIIDYETFPEWQEACCETEVLERDEEGRGRIVRLVVDAKVRVVSYTMAYSYEAPHRVMWNSVECDYIRRIVGGYTFEPTDGGGTLATYSVGIDAGIWVPGWIERMLRDQGMGRANLDLKHRAESLVSGAG